MKPIGPSYYWEDLRPGPVRGQETLAQPAADGQSVITSSVLRRVPKRERVPATRLRSRVASGPRLL